LQPSLQYPKQQEKSMSGVNGDKARFNRRRRQKISRRISNQKMLRTLADKNLVPAGSQAAGKEKAE
jgi:hypothetical protein